MTCKYCNSDAHYKPLKSRIRRKILVKLFLPNSKAYKCHGCYRKYIKWYKFKIEISGIDGLLYKEFR